MKCVTVALLSLLLAHTAHAGLTAPGSYASSRYWHQSVAADLVTRPDTLTVGFTLRKTGQDPTALVAQLEIAVAETTKRLQAASAGVASVRMSSLSIDAASDKQGSELRAVTVEGIADVPLAADADYWSRARLVAAIAQATKGFTDENAKKGLVARFDRPTAVLKDPESHRAELIKLWVERAHAFAVAAQSPATPLQLLQCDPPGLVQQIHLGLDEVALHLQQNCRIDTPRGK